MQQLWAYQQQRLPRFAKKIASDAEKAGKDAVAAVKAIATTNLKQPMKLQKLDYTKEQCLKCQRTKSMARTSDPDLFVGMQTTGPNLPGGKKARKKIIKSKVLKLPLELAAKVL